MPRLPQRQRRALRQIRRNRSGRGGGHGAGWPRSNVVCARAKASAALKDLIVTAPDELRQQVSALLYAFPMPTAPEIPTTPTDAVKIALQSLAIRCRDSHADTERLGHQIDTITADSAPRLPAVYGVGPDTAATNPPTTTWPADWPRTKPRTRPCAVSSATSPAKSSTPYEHPKSPQKPLPED